MTKWQMKTEKGQQDVYYHMAMRLRRPKGVIWQYYDHHKVLDWHSAADWNSERFDHTEKEIEYDGDRVRMG